MTDQTHIQQTETTDKVEKPAYPQGWLKVESLDIEAQGVAHRADGKVVQTFFNTLEKHTPQLVSWNGGGFDLPVLHYRGLRHGVVADRYWCMGEGGGADDREFKWNNYISRYHMRHLDLMDLLAMYQPKNNAPLDAIDRKSVV